MQQTVLMRSIERLVVAGETAGMSVEVMIHLLKAGMSVKLYLTSSGRTFAPPRKILLLPLAGPCSAFVRNEGSEAPYCLAR
jgi:hypothetical protein